MNVISGSVDGAGLRVGIVVARFNEFITRPLLDGATDTLARYGVDPEAITVAWVPGAVEIPLAAQKMAAGGNFDAVITLGAVIRGATSHFEYVCNMVSSGVNRVALDHSLPVIFGVLTVDTIEQAIERAGSKAGNNGSAAAVTAVEMASLLRQLS